MLALRSILRSKQSDKLGTLSGVFLPNILQMLGVILYMRLGWITGHVGLTTMLIIIGLSSSILLLTGLSMTSIVTNMNMGSGGSYYIISRSLGIELGAAIGILLSLSQMTSVALCVSGFAVSLQEWLPGLSLPLVKIFTILGLSIVSYVSINAAIKTQLIIALLLGASIYAVLSGSGSNIPADLPSLSTAAGLSFWTAFALFFPATTGIEAGMSFSGDLKKPSRSLPIGTISSVLAANVIYSSLAIFLAREVPADILRSYPMIACHVAKISFLVILGIWSATLSSALGGILGAPRTIQAIAKDGMLPKFLGKGFGPSELPRTGILISFIFASILSISTDINQLIPLLSMISLITYALINFVALVETVLKNPSWRPAVKIHWLIPLSGTFFCIISMFMFNAGATFMILALVFLLTLWAGRKKIKGNWADMRYGLFSFAAHFSVMNLLKLEQSVKNWRPNILAVIDPMLTEQNIFLLSHALNQSRGFLTFGISLTESIPPQDMIKQNIKDLLSQHKMFGFYQITKDQSEIQGIHNIINNYGIGSLRPNTVIFSLEQFSSRLPELLGLIRNCYLQNKNILLLKTASPGQNKAFSKTGKKKSINLWWRGRYPGNFEFCLALAHLLQHSKIWKRAELRINTIVPDELSREAAQKMFSEREQYLRLKRLSFTPLVHPQSDFFSLLNEKGGQADLTFLGLKPPRSDEPSASYETYLTDLLENTREIPNIVFILAGEKIDFRQLFS